jgi:hypothetical protein
VRQCNAHAIRRTRTPVAVQTVLKSNTHKGTTGTQRIARQKQARLMQTLNASQALH